MSVRDAIIDDAAGCLAIYRWYVENTAVSFEETAPGEAQIRKRMTETIREFPWLVYADRNRVAGYAYGSCFRPRPAYRWTAEVTIYLAQQAKGTGIAQILYQALFSRLAALGYYNAVAVITEPNPESECFHRKSGFRRIGAFESIGYKSGRWHDIGWWQKRLQPLPFDPGKPV